MAVVIQRLEQLPENVILYQHNISAVVYQGIESVVVYLGVELLAQFGVEVGFGEGLLEGFHLACCTVGRGERYGMQLRERGYGVELGLTEIA